MPRIIFPALVCLFALCLATSCVTAPSNRDASTTQQTVKLTAIDVSGFGSSRHHWRNLRDESRFIKVVPGQRSYRSDQVREIIANILLFQRENGGWPKDYDMTAVLTDAQKAVVLATKGRADTSFDNGNIHSQVGYLARAYTQENEPSWRRSCERGLDFILDAQYANGGWPQRFPDAKDFHAHITFNDYVMIGNLHLLLDIAEGKPEFAWLDELRRRRAQEAVARGIDCILRCQIKVDGKLTGWCQQHDEITLEPRPGRTFELASICPQDTTDILRFLMRIQNPRPEMVQAMDSAVAWLHQSKLSGVRVERIEAEPAHFSGHDADFDVISVPDKNAPPMWARHYEIDTNRPIFAGRDGMKHYSLEQIERERRTGTPYYGDWPARLLNDEYPKWRKQVR